MDLRPINRDEQAAAVRATQRAVWEIVTARFRELQVSVGLKQADLSRRLRVSTPQIHEWMSDPDNMSLKAAARLLAAMETNLFAAYEAEQWRREGAPSP